MIDTMTVNELKEKMDTNQDIVLVDCRELEEWNSGHIHGATLIPLSSFEEDSKILKNKNAKIVIHCRSGKRSLRACQLLNDEGFENLYNLEGGILAWEKEGLPIQKPNLD